MQKGPLHRDSPLCSGLLLFCYRNSEGGAVYRPIFVGASDGGMAAQIYTQKYPAEVGGLVLDSTGGIDAATLKIWMGWRNLPKGSPCGAAHRRKASTQPPFSHLR